MFKMYKSQVLKFTKTLTVLFLGSFQTNKSKFQENAIYNNFEHLFFDKTQLYNFDLISCASEQVNI